MFKFEGLDVWKKNLAFGEEIIKLSDRISQREQFSLGEQLRRASLSISANIAEGTGREGCKESRYFYSVAKGSVYEVVSLLTIMQRRGYLEESKYIDLCQAADEISKMLAGLIKLR